MRSIYRPKPARVTVAQAAARLGVKVETIYAYVSRGMLTRLAGAAKHSSFDAAQVERLRARGRRGAAAKPEALVIPSALTEITRAGVYYRGRDAVELARDLRFENIAEWLWGAATPGLEPAAWLGVSAPSALATARAVQSKLPAATLPIERLRLIATVLGSSDAMRYETSPAAVIATARSMMAGLVDALPTLGPPVTSAQLAARLWSKLCTKRASATGVHALDVAMTLCADHALSPSTLAVRIAASQRADPYAVVQTGLGALSGIVHGAASLAAEELLEQVEAGTDPSQVIGTRLRRGERIPGFGHALHPDGDPRAPALLALVNGLGKSRAVAATQGISRVMRERSLPPPNIDFALAALARSAGMTHGASEAIMAVARVSGWIAHALEEYATPTHFPWRAAYVGPPIPASSGTPVEQDRSISS